MHCQLSKGSIVFSMLIILELKDAFAVEWTADDKLESQFLEDMDFVSEHSKYIEKDSGSSKVLPKFARKRYDMSAPMYRSSNSKPSCSCHINYQAVDLGRGYLPRYIQIGACKNDSCEKHYQCVEKTYKVKVLKRKGVKTTEDASLMSVQNNFQDFWTIEIIPVVVSCECIAEFHMVYQE
ncbi:unnamed protein product [Phaedon cochleariae]|uniref:Prothoracicotropic hormone n=1 Tax=Phaedon cochleariae TaxID=80249 RepID=A0A9P0DR89_PHACE|nr:unnamed protein product [Phaedon cochleariae]